MFQNAVRFRNTGFLHRNENKACFLSTGAQTKGPQTKRLPDKRDKNTDKRATDKKAKKADKRAKNQSYILIVFSMKKLFFQCNKTDLELDLFEDVSIFVV